MKTRFLIIFVIGMIGFSGIAFASAFSTDCDYEICVHQAGSGEEQATRGSNYIVKVQVEPETKFSVKIFDPDLDLVFNETILSDKDGMALTDYKIPPDAKSGYYKVQLASYGSNGASHYGLIFTIDVSYDNVESKYLIGSGNLEQDGNSEWLEANTPIDVELITNNRFMNNINTPLEFTVFYEDEIVYNTTIHTNEEGRAYHSFELSNYGKYKLIVSPNVEGISDYMHRFVISKNPFHTFHEEGKDFIVSTRSSNPSITINSIEFDKQAKQLTLDIESIIIYDLLRIEIPYELLGEPYTIFVNGKLQNLDSDRLLSGGFYNQETTAVLAIPLEHGSTEIEIIGATAIPEFESIAVMILAVLILPLIIIQRFRIFRKWKLDFWLIEKNS